jgi:HlyD family secretion protein
MSAAVAIGVAEKKDVLLIPSSAVRTEGNRHIVRLKTGSSRSGDTFTDTQIRTGLVNDVQTEVLSGLKEGDAIAALGVPPVKK